MKVFKKLILPLSVLILLVAGLVVYTFLSKKPDEPEVESGNERVKLIDGKKAVKLTVVSNADKRKIIVSKSSKDGRDQYEVEGVSLSEGQTFSQRIVGNYFTSLTEIIADSSLGSGVALSDYGLDNPLYNISVEMEDGSSKSILFGNNSFDGKSVYAAMKDSKAVYTVDIGKMTEAATDPSTFISSKVWNIKFQEVSDLVFKRKGDLELAVEFDLNDGTKQPDYIITSPYSIKAGKSFVELIKKILDFEVSEYVTLNDEDITKLGLKDPKYSISLNLKFSDPKSVYFSEESDGYFYGYTSDDNSKYFRISKDLMKELELPEKSLINKSVISYDPTEIKSIYVTNGDDTFRVEMTVSLGNNLSSDSSKITLNKSNAKIITPEGRNFGSILFESIVNVDIDGIDLTVKPEFKSDFNVRVVTRSFGSDSYDFVKRSDQTYYVFLNEKYTGFYVKSDELFKKESKDSYSYGIIGAYELLKQAIVDNANGKYAIKPNSSKPGQSDDPSAVSETDTTVSAGESSVTEDDGYGIFGDSDESESLDTEAPDETEDTEYTEETEVETEDTEDTEDTEEADLNG